MTRYLLDTNHLSPLVTLDHPLRAKVLQQINSGDSFAIASPALNEFLFGIGTVKQAAQNWREWEFLRPSFTYYAVDAAIAEDEPDCESTCAVIVDNWKQLIRCLLLLPYARILSF